jgi:hypothetical protein
MSEKARTEHTQTVAESLVNLGITADSIAESVSDFVVRLVEPDAGSWHDIRAMVREHTRKELAWLDRLVKEAAAAGPTLTDAELEIIELHALRAGAICRSGCVSSSVANEACREEAALRGLLARAAKEETR